MNQTAKNDLMGYSFIRSQIIHTRVSPSLRDICKAVGYSSPRSAQLMLERLEQKGLIKRVRGAIILTSRKASKVTERTIEVPLVGSVPCGTPSLAEQEAEAVVEVSTRIAKPGHRYFILRAQGNSMNKAGINDHDLVLIRQQPVAQTGDRVVALINDEATIKEYLQGKNATVLMPRSKDPKYKPIILTEDFQIQGVVVTTIPEF
ncbi:MAG: transcriptional repressor LexA [Desulfobulbaceae bacterium]|nr:transcriptional repressor LexA [Desulfobulbaceae bacterium]